MKVVTYDCTLRDGEQAEGITLSLEDKLRIARRLDDFGIDIIEGGFPASNPKDIAFFKELRERPLKNARLAAFGSTCKKGVLASEDAGLADLVQSGAPVVAIVGKTWDAQVTKALQTTLDENLRMISDSVTYLVEAGREVVFDAEHFFDGYKANPSYALECISAAAIAGVSSIDLCDTNGGSLPMEIAAIVDAVVLYLDKLWASAPETAAAEAAAPGATSPETAAPEASASEAASPRPRIGVHCHNDSGCAVANSITAVACGATQVQGTMNGYGERVGNANLLTIIADLQLKMGCQCIPEDSMTDLTSLAAFVAEVCNKRLPANEPYVGASAFAHKGGLHASAIARFPQAYEHTSPASVGNATRMLVSELAGKASLAAKAQDLGIIFDADNPSESVQKVLDEVKAREAAGYSYEVADGSLALLIERTLGRFKPHFSLESFRVIVDDREDTGALAKDAQSEATIKVLVGDERYVATGEGVGPVGALATALHIALKPAFPEVESMQLVDFKVRLLDESTGTDAITRVAITTRDSHGSWGTIGVSENIIEASWNALVEAIEYGLIRAGV